MQRFMRLFVVAVFGAPLAALSLVFPLHADAATVMVTVATDTTAGVSGNCPGPSCSLRDAIAHAAANDTVSFNTSLTGQTITLTHGTLTLTRNVTINGLGAASLTVDGGCTASCGTTSAVGGVTVFTVNNAVTNATISGLTIQHGNAGTSAGGGGINNSGTLTVASSTITANATGSGFGPTKGGGINSSGTLTVTNCIISGNAAGDGGGGIYAANPDQNATLMVTDSTIFGNTATYGGGISTSGTATLTNSIVRGNSVINVGGGIYSEVALTVTGGTIGGPTALDGNTAGGSGGGVNFSGTTLVLNGVTVSHNTTNATLTSGGGGGLYIVTDTASITNSTISNNTATDGVGGEGGDGGGINTIGSGITTITNSTISGNTAFDTGDSGFGGGIVNFSATVNLINSTVSGNIASGTSQGEGGGIGNTGTVSVTGSTISGNTASGGKGGGLENGATATMTVTNSTITGNTATGSGAQGIGGGIYNHSGSGKLFQLTYTTVARNTASTSGGGIRNEGNLQSVGTIIAANSGGDCSTAALGVLTSQGYNLADDGSCTLTMPTDRPNDANPGLAAALAANGSTGPLTLALLPGSGAIDHGGTSANGCPATDERGTGRPIGAACDIGAFEAQTTPNPLPTPQPSGPNLGGPPAPLPPVRPLAGPINPTRPNPLPSPRP